MPLDDNEAWLHPIKAISVKRDKPGVPRPEGTYDSGHEPLDEDELHDYQARVGLLGDPQDDIGQSLMNTSSQVYMEIMASNHFPVMQDVPQRL